MPAQFHTCRLHRGCKGFSLVELMVALVITLILLAGIAQIFLGSKKSFTIQESLGRMQENGRYATEVLIQDLRRAGYWGGNADITEITGTQSHFTETGTCSDNTWARMLSHRIFGKDDSRAGYGCLPAIGTHTGDILVMRFAAPWRVGGITTPTFQNNHFYLRSTLFEGRLFLGSEEASNTISNPAVRTSELVARAYFIHDSPQNSKCPADGLVPSLYRLGLVNGALTTEEIAYGVENFQVQYGLDTDTTPDGSVDTYVNAAAAADAMWGQVIAARIWILVRAECPETGYTNNNTYAMGNVNYTPADPANRGYRRQLFTSTVRLRNN
jgi:type IV pilus assembly protein PilW